MSLLSDTQGSPERVWSLLNLLAAHGGELNRDEVIQWLVPNIRRVSGGKPIQNPPPNPSAAKQTIGAATSLKLVATGTDSVQLSIPDVPSTLEAFGDLVHARLLETSTDDPDYLILQVFAWFVVQCELSAGTEWIVKLSRDQLADKVVKDLQGSETGGDPIFNSTKYPFWRNWACFVGLGIDAPATLPSFFPYIYTRLAREVRRLGTTLGFDTELDPNTFLNALAPQMPYIDGGVLFNSIASSLRMRTKTAQLSIVLSNGIRELHDDGVVTVKAPGDASDTIQLAPDPGHKLKYLKTIVINGSV